MTTIQLTLTLSDSLAQAAQQAGLLKPEAIEQLLRDAVRRQDSDAFFEAADRLVAAAIPPMTLEEIQEEVKVVRAARSTERRP